MNAHDNERVEIGDMRGCVARDLHGAFKEWHAQSTVTNCTKYLYSLSVNPDQRQGRLTKDQYLDLLDRIERKLGLHRQGRVVVFHEKKDKDGIVRQHCHAVWSRIDARRGRAIAISFDRFKRVAIARAFARELGRTIPQGMEAERQSPDFRRKAANVNLAETQQQERSGIGKAERRQQITEAWRQSHDGPGFVAALQRRGYVLARGGRLSYAVIDRAGEMHGLGTQVDGVRSPEVKARLAASHPLPSLPSTEEAQRQVAERHEKLKAQQKPAQRHAPAGPTPDERRGTLQREQQARRQELAETRRAMQQRHIQERQPQGTRPRLPMPKQQGMRRAVERLSQVFQQQRQGRAIERRQKVELRDLARQEKAMTTIEGRERRSLETRIKRDEFQQLAKGLAGLTPILDRLARSGPKPPERTIAKDSLRSAFAPDRPAETPAHDHARRAAERLRHHEEQPRKPKPDL